MKKTKYDPFAEFRNVASGTSKCGGHVSDIDNAEFLRYSSIIGVDLQQPDAVRSVFDPLLCWGQQSFNFPILSHLVRQILANISHSSI